MASKLVVGVVAGGLALAGASCSDDPSEADQAQDAATKLQEGLEAHQAGDVDEAKDLYKKTLDLDDRNQYAVYNLGVIDQEAGRSDRAEERYRRAIALDPHLTSALFNLAILRAEAGAADEAASLYQQVIDHDANHAGAHLNLGFVYLEKLNRPMDAEAEFTRAVAIDPNLAQRLPAGAI